MPMDIPQLRGYLQKFFPDAEIYVKDVVGDGDHYAVTIISELFWGKSRLQQHQMVYQALQGHIGTTLHALSLTTHPKETKLGEYHDDRKSSFPKN
jgi:stress-induced morphogen